MKTSTTSKQRPKSIQDQIDEHVPVDQYVTSRIRGLCRAGFEVSTPYIVSIAKGEIETAAPAVSVKAHDNLGKYGMSEQPKHIFLECRTWLPTIFELAAKHFKDNANYNDFTIEAMASLENLQ
jgi:hypothetical protein